MNTRLMNSTLDQVRQDHYDIEGTQDWESAGSSTPANYRCIKGCSAAARCLSDSTDEKAVGDGAL